MGRRLTLIYLVLSLVVIVYNLRSYLCYKPHLISDIFMCSYSLSSYSSYCFFFYSSSFPVFLFFPFLYSSFFSSSSSPPPTPGRSSRFLLHVFGRESLTYTQLTTVRIHLASCLNLTDTYYYTSLGDTTPANSSSTRSNSNNNKE